MYAVQEISLIKYTLFGDIANLSPPIRVSWIVDAADVAFPYPGVFLFLLLRDTAYVRILLFRVVFTFLRGNSTT